MTLRPSDVGRRVVVRYRLARPIEGAHATDVLGELTAWSGGRLTVRTKTGNHVDVAEDDVLVAKVIPPQTVTRRDVRDLEAAAAGGWQALDTAQLGGWLLRAAGGFTGRANSCLPLSDPARPISRAIDDVERWYDDRGLTPAFQVPGPLGARLDAELDARGWQPAPEDVLVMTATLAPVARAVLDDLPQVLVRPEPDDAWLARYHYRGGALPPQAREVMLNAELVGFASVDDHDNRVAVGRGAITDSPAGRRWLGVTAIEVDPLHRRRGIGTHIMTGLAEWAARHGASDIYLQVSEHNDVGLATYAKVGFVEHHRYHYRRRDSSG